MRSGRSFRQALRATIAFALAYLMVWGGVPAPALAKMAEEAMAEEPLAITTEPINVPVEGGQGNDELLDAYVQHKLDETLAQVDEGVRLGVQSARDGLSATHKKAYDKLKQLASNVAAGSAADTMITIPIADLMDDCGPWTASDLGVTTIVEGRQITEDAKDAVFKKIMGEALVVIHALLADCPYEFYWFDKTAGYGVWNNVAVTRKNGERALSVGDVNLALYVSADYSVGGQVRTPMVDTSKTAHVNTAIGTAINEAQQIVNASADLSNYNRLKAYKNAICEAASYNKDAAKNSGATPYGNPWQLIWVFDKSVSTNVVCEGYAKAFKYLCDLTWTGENPAVECLLVTGTMHGGTGAGPHMWNVVRMDDGRNYLVDVTNCDGSSVGAPDKLFMAYGPTGSYDITYSFKLGGNATISYQYDDATKSNFSAANLIISAQQYQSSEPKTRVNVPVAVTGLVYNGRVQTGVAAGTGYSLQNNTATNAGSYTAIATLDDGYVWSDGSTGTKRIAWSIAPKSEPNPTPTPTKTFPDVPASAWYAGVVGRAAGLGLINGYKDGRFGPNDNVTRGQVAVILWNMAGKPGPKGAPKNFPDVKSGKYYYDAVRWASSAGVVSGYKNGRFGPDDLVTREQLAAMLANYAGKVAGKDTSGSAADYRSMKDAAKVSSWASKSVGWCFRNGIISGTKDGRVNPQGNATRAETAKMVVFLHDML